MKKLLLIVLLLLSCNLGAQEGCGVLSSLTILFHNRLRLGFQRRCER